MFIGLDKNNNNQTKNFFKVGGAWQNSSYEGSLFIRPEFGTTNPWPVSVENVNKEPVDFLMYPNPTSSIINIEVPFGNYQVILRSIVGTIVKTISVQEFAQMSTSDLPSGIYMVEVNDLNSGNTNIKKLLIQH